MTNQPNKKAKKITSSLPPPRHNRIEHISHPDVYAGLSRLAVMHEFNQAAVDDAVRSSFEYRQAPRNIVESGRRYHQNPYEYPPADWPLQPKDAAEKEMALNTIYTMLDQESAAHDPGRPLNWQAVASDLLQRAETGAEDDKNNLLVSAVVASQAAADNVTRITFLEEVYDRNLQAAVAAACEQSPLYVLVQHQPIGAEDRVKSVHALKDMAQAFSAIPANVDKYLLSLRAAKGPHTEVPSGQKALRSLLSTRASPKEHQAAQAQAEAAGLNESKMEGSPLIDLYKVERFALQQEFIERQMRDVLARDTQGRTAFAAGLAALRHEPNATIDTVHLTYQGPDRRFNILENLQGKLSANIIGTMRQLSEPALQEFTEVVVADDDMGSLTRPQLAARRYREVTAMLGSHIGLSRFIDIKHFIETNRAANLIRREDEAIGTISASGGALEQVTVDLISDVVVAAINQPQNEKPPSADELRSLVLAHKPGLLRKAAHQFSEFIDIPQYAALQLSRDTAGKLVLDGLPEAPKAGSQDLYYALLLGCPALRLKHENIQLEKVAERMAANSANYLDTLITIVINEAYGRGFFAIPSLSPKQ